MAAILILKTVDRNEHVKRNYRLFGRTVERGSKRYQYEGVIDTHDTIKLTDSVYFVGGDTLELAGKLEGESAIVVDTNAKLDEVKKHVKSS